MKHTGSEGNVTSFGLTWKDCHFLAHMDVHCWAKLELTVKRGLLLIKESSTKHGGTKAQARSDTGAALLLPQMQFFIDMPYSLRNCRTCGTAFF